MQLHPKSTLQQVEIPPLRAGTSSGRGPRARPRAVSCVRPVYRYVRAWPQTKSKGLSRRARSTNRRLNWYSTVHIVIPTFVMCDSRFIHGAHSSLYQKRSRDINRP